MEFPDEKKSSEEHKQTCDHCNQELNKTPFGFHPTQTSERLCCNRRYCLCYICGTKSKALYLTGEKGDINYYKSNPTLQLTNDILFNLNIKFNNIGSKHCFNFTSTSMIWCCTKYYWYCEQCNRKYHTDTDD